MIMLDFAGTGHVLVVIDFLIVTVVAAWTMLVVATHFVQLLFRGRYSRDTIDQFYTALQVFLVCLLLSEVMLLLCHVPEAEFISRLPECTVAFAALFTILGLQVMRWFCLAELRRTVPVPTAAPPKPVSQCASILLYKVLPHEFPQRVVTDVCTICLSPYQDSDAVFYLRCRHYFHTTCLETWWRERSVCAYCGQDPWIS
jgi:hypothetical protein